MHSNELNNTELNNTHSYDLLLDAIYQSAMEPEQWPVLGGLMLKNFRQDSRNLDDEDGGLMRSVKTHLKRALTLGVAQERLKQERFQLASMMDMVAPATWIVDGSGQLLSENIAARGIRQSIFKKQGSFLCIEANGGDLLRWIHEAKQSSVISRRLDKSENGSPERNICWLFVLRLSPQGNVFALMVFEEGQPFDASVTQAVRLYGLTEKEGELVRGLMHADSLQQLAADQSISYHTLRQHLGAIYDKTGVRTHSALLSLVLRQVVFRHLSASGERRWLPQIAGLSRSRMIRVREGRQLCYAELGAPKGKPVLYFASVFGSRLELSLHHELLQSMNIRLIAVDRPGYGHSDFYEYPDYQDYTCDIVCLLDALRLDRVEVLSCSGGTPHALACAAFLPERIDRLHCTGIVPPYDDIVASDHKTAINNSLSSLLRIAPGLLQPMMDLMLSGLTVESLFRELTNRQSPLFNYSDLDIEYISEPERLEHFIAFTVESLRQGTRTWVKEVKTVNRDWGIPFDQIHCPVYLWHGDQDTLIAPDMVTSFSKRFPNARLKLIPGEAHLMVFRCLETVLSTD